MRPAEATRPVAGCTANGPRGDDLAGRQINSVATPERQSLQDQCRAAPIRIGVAPMACGKWQATFNGDTLCTVTAPMVKAARILIAKGFDSFSVIEMWHEDADAWALRGNLGAVAATLIDGQKAQRPAKNGPPIRFPRMTATHDRNGPPQALAGGVP